MIRIDQLRAALHAAIVEAALNLPPDIETALRAALSEETDPLAIAHLEASLENARLAGEGMGLVCGDTGFPLYFVKAGPQCVVEGGWGSLWRAAEEATARATDEALLRPTMVDPLTRQNPGRNTGPGMPRVKLRFSECVEGLDVVAAPKGGGSEIFGTFYRMLFPADGSAAVRKFVLDCVRTACYAGKVCPPAIIGVGLGGTADLCMEMAKEAALLRRVGGASPRADVAALEQDLLNGCRGLGIGPMGARGVNGVMAVHIECALTHTAALPVAVNAQCLVGRRWRAQIAPDGSYDLTGEIAGWFQGWRSCQVAHVT
jgi:tartrate/fumarate subfamily iron-sulfur-dependent hydro-lyase alpha chain